MNWLLAGGIDGMLPVRDSKGLIAQPDLFSRIAIRTATPEDYPQIAEMQSRAILNLARGAYSPGQLLAWEADQRLSGSVRSGQLFVAELDDRIIATRGWAPEIERARLHSWYVDPDFAGQGVGKMIALRAERAALEAGFKTLYAWASLGSLHIRKGWTLSSRKIWLTAGVPIEYACVVKRFE